MQPVVALQNVVLESLVLNPRIVVVLTEIPDTALREAQSTLNGINRAGNRRAKEVPKTDERNIPRA